MGDGLNSGDDDSEKPKKRKSKKTVEVTEDAEDEVKLMSGSRPKGLKRYDFLYKILMVGDAGVGKTSLLSRFTANGDEEVEVEDGGEVKFVLGKEYLPTIVIDFKMRVVELKVIFISVILVARSGFMSSSALEF